MSYKELKPYEAADLAPDTYIGEYFQPSVEVYKKADVDEELESKNMMLEELAGALEEIARCLSHGLQDCRASIIAKDTLGKYQQSKARL